MAFISYVLLLPLLATGYVFSFVPKQCDLRYWHMSVMEYLMEHDRKLTENQQSIQEKVERLVEHAQDLTNAMVPCSVLNSYSSILVPEVNKKLMANVMKQAKLNSSSIGEDQTMNKDSKIKQDERYGSSELTEHDDDNENKKRDNNVDNANEQRKEESKESDKEENIYYATDEHDDEEVLVLDVYGNYASDSRIENNRERKDEKDVTQISRGDKTSDDISSRVDNGMGARQDNQGGITIFYEDSPDDVENEFTDDYHIRKHDYDNNDNIRKERGKIRPENDDNDLNKYLNNPTERVNIKDIAISRTDDKTGSKGLLLNDHLPISTFYLTYCVKFDKATACDNTCVYFHILLHICDADDVLDHDPLTTTRISYNERIEHVSQNAFLTKAEKRTPEKQVKNTDKDNVKHHHQDTVQIDAGSKDSKLRQTVHEESPINKRKKSQKQQLENAHPSGKERLDSSTLDIEKLELIIQKRESEQATKIQELELMLLKLENKILTQTVDKQSDSHAFAALENQILKLQNELLKLNQGYQKLQEDHETLKTHHKQYSFELQQGDQNSTPLRPKYLALADNSSKELMTQQVKITELTSFIENQSTLVQKLQSKSEFLEDQNRKLFEIVMNQTSVVSNIMITLQELSEEGAQAKIRGQEFYSKLEKLKETLGSDKLLLENDVKYPSSPRGALESLDFATDSSIKEILAVSLIDIASVILRTMKKLPGADSPPLSLERSWQCNGSNSTRLCLFETVVITNCTPFRDVSWLPCKTRPRSLILDLPLRGKSFGTEGIANYNVYNPGTEQQTLHDYASETVMPRSDSQNDGLQLLMLNIQTDSFEKFHTKNDVEDMIKNDLHLQPEFLETTKQYADSVNVHISNMRENQLIGAEFKFEGGNVKQEDNHKTPISPGTTIVLESQPNPQPTGKSLKVNEAEKDKVESRPSYDKSINENSENMGKKQHNDLKDDYFEEKKLAVPKIKPLLDEVLNRKVLYKSLHKGRPTDCYDLYKRGQEHSGMNQIFVSGLDVYVSVFCDKGWTILLKRDDGSLDFYRDYEQYSEGFGTPPGEHYLGNDVIHHLTNQGHYSLKVELSDWQGNTRHAYYDHFWVDGENDSFKLHLFGYSGNAGDGLGKHNGMKFSTLDVDHDLLKTEMGGNCAKRFHGAGWYYKCYASNLMGRYYKGGNIPDKMFDGVTWKPWLGPGYSLKTAVLAIRPFVVDV